MTDTTATKYVAYALTTDKVEAIGATRAEDILIQAYTMDDDGRTQIYTGDFAYIATGELTDVDDLDAALAAAGWTTTGQGWVESAGQWIAEVTR